MKFRVSRIENKRFSIPILSAIDQLHGARHERLTALKGHAIKGAGLGAAASIPGAELAPKEYRVASSIGAMVLGGAIGAVRGFRKDGRVVNANTLALARHMAKYYSETNVNAVIGASLSGAKRPAYFSSTAEHEAAWLFHYIVNNYKYIFVNRKMEIVGSNRNPRRFGVGYLRIETEKIRRGDYLHEDAKI